MTFQGFSDEALEFYERLATDNSRTFWQEHRPDYLRLVREPMTALMTALEPEFGPGTIYRPHRDVRFSADKSPIKDHQGGFVSLPDGTGWYVQISSAGLMVAGGMYDPRPDQLARYRAAVDDTRRGRQLEAIASALAEADLAFGSDLLKTRPRGFPADHARLGLLRIRRPVAWGELGAPDWLATPAAFEHVVTAWRQLAPLNRWLGRAVGPSSAAP
ncbi:MAG TPA: DUF2461 domain-containing protein [Actinomycetes bacterium]|nr:DUF2461 domain-containing protein [Actinomycetes bacterium]